MPLSQVRALRRAAPEKTQDNPNGNILLISNSHNLTFFKGGAMFPSQIVDE
jgi:hypothetical protein